MDRSSVLYEWATYQSISRTSTKTSDGLVKIADDEGFFIKNNNQIYFTAHEMVNYM
jgi:hypothetical protein